MDDCSGVDICRVCRSEGLPERPLFHPCICTGSIKWIHQECLVQWMRYSRKEYCELCSHHFSFTPIYSPDMPRHLPLKDVAGGLLSSIKTVLKCWLHYTLVVLAWLGFVPLTACRIYRCLFSESIITLPSDILKTQNIPSDVFHGCFVLACTLFAFVGMVWLREQIVHGGGPDWLEPEQEIPPAQQQQQLEAQHEDDHLLLHDDLPEQADSYNLNNNNTTATTTATITATYNNDGDNSDTFNNDAIIRGTDGFYANGESSNDTDCVGADNVISPALNTVSGNNGTSKNKSNADTGDNNILGASNGKLSSNLNSEDMDIECYGSHLIKNKYFEDTDGNNSSSSISSGRNNNINDNDDDYDENENINNNTSNGCNNNDMNKNDYNSVVNENDDNEIHDDLNNGTDFENRLDRFEEHHENLNEIQEENEEREPANAGAAERNQDVDIEGGEVAAEGGENAQDDGNWNPVEWDRAVEELTWERLLGLDGSLVFLEHVFWVMLLNTLFIFLFAFLPYHFGNFAINGLGLREKTVGTHFAGLITTLCGYCIIGLCLVVLHTFASLLGLQRSKRILGLCYVIVKVSLLSVVEIGVFPLICGWWLDICSLSMFDSTFKDRETSFRLAPGTSMFIHWLVGMVYVYYFASFIVLLREVVRPGVLWFLINLNDPDFSPIQEMIHTPIIHHVRRLLASSVIFGTAVLLMLWIPVRIIQYLWPTFLPYAVALQIEAQMNELSLELVLLQVILPSLLEQSHTRVWMKASIRLWCKFTSWLFGIHSYLLGDDEEESENTEQPENNDVLNGFGAVRHQALLQREGPVGVQPYHKPRWFYARLLGLLFAVCVSLIIASSIALTLPVWIGRRVMEFWIGGNTSPGGPTNSASADGEEISTRVHELYTAACGTYLCWLTARTIALLRSWLPQGRAAILDYKKMRQWFIWGAKSLIALIFLLGVIPLLFGLLLEFVIVVPARVPLDQTPVLFVWQDWALGVLYTKIACAIIMMGPDCKTRRAIERVYRDGIRNIDLPFILHDLVIPVTAGFSLALAVPYAVAHSIIPLIVTNAELKIIIARLLYPCVLLLFMLSSLIAFQIRQFKRLYEHIKNDKYLVGKRLVNYDHRRRKSNNAL